MARLTRTGLLQPRAADMDGAALRVAERRNVDKMLNFLDMFVSFVCVFLFISRMRRENWNNIRFSRMSARFAYFLCFSSFCIHALASFVLQCCILFFVYPFVISVVGHKLCTGVFPFCF